MTLRVQHVQILAPLFRIVREQRECHGACKIFRCRLGHLFQESHNLFREGNLLAWAIFPDGSRTAPPSAHNCDG